MKYNLFKFILLGYLMFIQSLVGIAQSYYFKQISLKEGISQSTVQAILCDAKQVLWLGTKDGLNRFDGYELRNYFFEANDSTSLLGNNIFFIKEDLIGDIWIGTQHGICRYRENSDDFESVLFEGKPIYSRCCVVMKDHVAFITNGSICKYYYSTRRTEKISMTGKAEKCYITRAQKWDEHSLLIAGRWGSVYLLDIHTGKSVLFSKSKIENATALLVDCQKRVWVGQYNKGVFVYNEKGEKIREYTVLNSELKNNIVLDLLEKQQQIWMATDGGGINILDLSNNEISAIVHIPGENYTLPGNSVICLYEDGENNIWVGSVRNGVFGVRSVYMQTYSDAPLGSPNGISDRSVVSLYEDDDKTIWVGTDGGGVNRFDTGANGFVHYKSTYGAKVSSIYGLNEKELLLSVFGQGLVRFNKQSGAISPILIMDKQTTDSIYSMGTPVIIHPGRNGQFYIFGNRTFLFDTSKNEFKVVRSEPNAYNVQPFYHSKEYSYLLSENSILRLSHSTHLLKEIWTINSKTKIKAACFDGKHTIYIGSDSGIMAYDLQTKVATPIITSLFNSVTSLLWEQEDRIWIGAKNKLFSYNPVDKKFIVFGNSDGVFPNELFSRPTLVGLQGDIYMGGSMGLLRICKNKMSTDFHIPELMLTRMEIDGEYYDLRKRVVEQKIHIPWNFGSIHLNFMVKEGNFFREKKFRYTIKGSKDLLFETAKPFLTLAALPEGEYTIFAQCDTQSGEWTDPAVYATITVDPPWWKSTLFIVIYIMVSLGLIVLGVFYVIRRSKNRLRWEMKEHEQKINEEKIQFLININHELRTPLTLIYSSLERMVKNQEAISENIQLRSVFRQARQMRSIINMVLDMRKMEVGKETLYLQVEKYNEWVKSIADDFKIEFEAKNIELVLDIDPAVTELSFDKDKCEKAFTNILMNALKFSDSHSRVIVSTQLCEDCVKLSVTDQGIGLGENIDHLFQRFYQGNHNRGGTGIGLSYSKLMIELQGGRIGAYNNENGVGATFFINLPIRMEVCNVSCQPKPYINELLTSDNIERAEVDHLNLEQYSVLIVEDEPELKQYLKEAFTGKFQNVYTARDGEDAFEEIINSYPDIIVSDVMMPKMNGYELCKKVKTDLRCSHTPIILLTARGDSQSEMLGYKTGADAYLSKPFDLEMLNSVIETQLRNREFVKLRYKNRLDMVVPDETTISVADEQFLNKLNNLIMNNLESPEFDIKSLAREMGMSRSSFYVKTKQLIGSTIGEYITKLRINEAERLLINTDLSILDVADKVGFATQRYFSLVFKQTYNVAPTKYRSEKRGKASTKGKNFDL